VAGVGVAITEIAIGLLTIAGFYTQVAAAGGLSLNFLLFLTASWNTTPYFLGPDLVFSFAWLPFVLTGASGQPALDNISLRPSEAMMRRTRLRPPDPRQSPEAAATSTRRVLLAEFAAAALAIAGVSTLAKGSYTAAKTLTAGGKGGGTKAGPTTAKNTSASSPPSNGKVPANAVKLAPGNRLPKGQAATYADPGDGSPDILIRGSDGSLKAFSAVCTHAGCTVGYENGTIVCPCHGGEYNAETGEVIAGPPPAPLEPKKVVEVGGQLYAIPT
jgi:thiosulfate dehydrogenase [quinone] large subunit